MSGLILVCPICDWRGWPLHAILSTDAAAGYCPNCGTINKIERWLRARLRGRPTSSEVCTTGTRFDEEGREHWKTAFDCASLPHDPRLNECLDCSYQALNHGGQQYDPRDRNTSGEDTMPKQTPLEPEYLVPPDKMGRKDRIRSKMQEIMRELGLDVEGNLDLIETPDRFARFLLEFNQHTDIEELMKTFDYDDNLAKESGLPMVIVQKIPLAALCEHHFCPFYGEVAIGYIPGQKIVGLSKLARLVYAVGHARPTVQERMTNDLANWIEHTMTPKGVMVVAKAEHTCMTVRGVSAPGVITTTSAIRGAFVHSPQARVEFLSLLER